MTSSDDDHQLADAAALYLSFGRVLRALRRTDDGSIGPSAASALATITRGEPIRSTDLAAAEQVSAPTISRIVAALERDGYVLREPDPEDGRASLLRATDLGHTLVAGLTSARIRALHSALAELDGEHRTALTAGMLALEGSLISQALVAQTDVTA